jgi:hypothetical protein
MVTTTRMMGCSTGIATMDSATAIGTSGRVNSQKQNIVIAILTQ